VTGAETAVCSNLTLQLQEEHATGSYLHRRRETTRVVRNGAPDIERYAPDSKEFLEYCVLFPDAIDRQRGAECLAAEQHAKEWFAAIAAKDAA
jgi:hypothetical protein